MATTKQFPRKHIGKKTTEAEKQEIAKIQSFMKCSYLEAKHKYFEESIPKLVEKIQGDIINKVNKVKMTVSETKLGVTVVLSHSDCEELGWDIKLAYPRDVIGDVRKKLNLPSKEELKAERKKQ